VKGQPPWAWNVGNQVYPEDIAAVKKMDEYHSDKQNMEAKKKSNKKAAKGR
jgi:hypothetical protein